MAVVLILQKQKRVDTTIHESFIAFGFIIMEEQTFTLAYNHLTKLKTFMKKPKEITKRCRRDVLSVKEGDRHTLTL